jgi:hypothetical protein
MDIHEKDTLIDQDQRFKGALLCQMNVFTYIIYISPNKKSSDTLTLPPPQVS